MLWLFIVITCVPLVFCPTKIFNGFALPQTAALGVLSALGLAMGVYNGLFLLSAPIAFLFLFLAYITLSIGYTDPVHNARKEYSLQMPLLIICFLAASSVEKSDIKWIILSSTIVLLLISVYSILQTKGIDPLFTNSRKKGGSVTNPIGTIGNPNFLAGYICSSLWLSVYLSTTFSPMFLVITLFCLYTLIITKVRAGHIALVGSLFFVLGIEFYYNNSLPDYYFNFVWYLSLVLFIIGIAFLYVNWDTFWNKPIDPKGKQVWYATLRYRLCYWMAAFEMIKEKPFFGNGLWSYRKGVYKAQAVLHDKYPNFLNEKRYITPQPRECHNDFIEHIVEFGIIGFTIFITFVVLVYIAGFRYLNLVEYGTSDFILMLVLLTNFTCVLINAFFFFSLRIPSSAMMFWLTCGFILTLGYQVKLFYSFGIIGSVLVLVVLSPFIYEYIVKRVITSRYFYKYQVTRSFDEKWNYLNKALKLSPNDSILRTHAGINSIDIDPALGNFHANSLIEHYDGQTPLALSLYNAGLAKIRTINIYDEALYYLKVSHWLLPHFKPTRDLLLGSNSVSSRAKYKGGKTFMRIADEKIVWKCRAILKDKENIGIQINSISHDLAGTQDESVQQNLLLRIEILKRDMTICDFNVQNTLLTEKKRLNIPDSWFFDIELGQFIDPNTLSAQERAKKGV